MTRQPSLELLQLMEDELNVAKQTVREMAYFRWQAAGCPDNQSLRFWLEAELEWVEYQYDPDHDVIRMTRPSSR